MQIIKEIVVLSGKGGTGKTSVAASLAYLAKNEAVLADCDVDASNLHLIMEPKKITRELFYGGEVARVIEDKCVKCGKCNAVCRFNAINIIGGIYHINELDCEGCGYCYHICPENAIEMKPRKSGESYLSVIKNASVMAHAKLYAGGENSGKLVATVKKSAYSAANENGCKYIITDGAPGIGCPVVSSLSGATVALLVTEPTMSALHDLKRLLYVIRRFNITPLLIVNKCDINTNMSDEIKQFAQSEGIEHIADIRFNSLFVESMSRSRIVIEDCEYLYGQFQSIWDRIKEVANQLNN